MSNAGSWPYDSAAGQLNTQCLISIALNRRGMSNADGWPDDSAAGPVSIALFEFDSFESTGDVKRRWLAN